MTVGFVRASYRLSIYDSLYKEISEKERMYLQAYRSFESRYDSLLGLLLARQLSGACVNLVHDVKGKPVMKGSEKEISITHSSGITAAVVSPWRIGIDLEKNVEEKAGRRMLAAAGQSLLHSFPFTVLWTRTEAYAKMIGCGFKEDPALLFQEAAAPRSRWNFHTECFDKDMVLTICSEKPAFFQLKECFEDTVLQNK